LYHKTVPVSSVFNGFHDIYFFPSSLGSPRLRPSKKPFENNAKNATLYYMLCNMPHRKNLLVPSIFNGFHIICFLSSGLEKKLMRLSSSAAPVP